MLESNPLDAGSARTHLLALQVILTEIANRDTFDQQWQEWIDPDPERGHSASAFRRTLRRGSWSSWWRSRHPLPWPRIPAESWTCIAAADFHGIISSRIER